MEKEERKQRGGWSADAERGLLALVTWICFWLSVVLLLLLLVLLLVMVVVVVVVMVVLEWFLWSRARTNIYWVYCNGNKIDII